MIKRARSGRFMICAIVFMMLAPAFPLLVAPALAKNITVCPSGCAFITIAAALAADADGDDIQIGPGTYAGGVNIARNVNLSGVGSDQTTIAGTSQDSVIHVQRGAAVRIAAVTITGGGGSAFGAQLWGGGGILNEGALTLADSVVSDNAVTQGFATPANFVGGGIANASSKPLKIANSEILNNQASNGGGFYNLAGDVVINNGAFSGNRISTVFPAMAAVSTSCPTRSRSSCAASP